MKKFLILVATILTYSCSDIEFLHTPETNRLNEISVEKHGEDFVGETIVKTKRPFVISYQNEDYVIYPSEEPQFLLGDENSIPRFAATLTEKGTRFLYVSDKEEKVHFIVWA